LELIDHLARTLPHVSFVFIGRVAVDVNGLTMHKNVHFLGQRSYETLPNYLKAFDVCLLVYKMGEFAKHANPKKLREYLAGGKPVVSVRLREVEELADVVYIADSYQEFANLIQRALDEDCEDRRHTRLSAVASLSWPARVDRLSDVIVERIPATGSPRVHTHLEAGHP
jgi:glycosyltransferase involved in cell wall biosynthesis